MAEALLVLQSSFGNDTDGFYALRLREELSNIVGTATESVIRQLSDFKSDRLIELCGRKIKLLNIKQLERYANMP